MSDGIQRGSTETRRNKNNEQNVLRRMEEGTDVDEGSSSSASASTSSSSSSSGNTNAKSPHCEALPLIIPPGVPFQIHSSPQIVIAHRGASAHLPEHSLEGYRLALELGADYIEPDLVATADHHLVAMHSLDLSVTTNVEQVFGASKNKTRSKYKMDIVDSDSEATGYWVYDFTLAELKQLRLKQRLGGSEKNGRTKAFDGLFEIPTLTEILELLNDWNENIQPLWYHDSTEFIESQNIKIEPRHRYPPPPRGLYAELKDFPWLLKDANINLVDLFFDHIRDEPSVWEKALLRNMCDTKKMREHEYRLPPLVMQSFEAEVLKNFTSRWDDLSHNNKEELSYETLNSNGETVHIPLPTPPTILLVSHDKCLEEKFWFEMEDSYRKVITGIGPDKMCFFKTNKDNPMGETLFRYEPTVMRKATENGWMVHPWTMRPEEGFFATSTNEGRKTRNLDERAPLVPFQNVLEELLFLKCTVGVHGVFSESVDVAVRAMGMACPDGNDRKGHGGNSATASSNSNSLSFDTNEIPLGPVISFSFVSGILAALLLLKFCGGGRSRGTGSNNGQQSQQQPPQRRRAPRIPGRRSSNLPPHSAIPTEAADDDIPVVLDETDREIL